MKFTGERMIPERNKDREIYMEHIARYSFALQFVKNKKVLDIACGSGYGSQMIIENGAKHVTGVDISEEAILYCKNEYQHKNLEFKVGNVAKIPLEDDSVDVIISFETLEHVNEDVQREFLLEINRVLKRDGFLVISTPNSLVSPVGNEFHLKELNKDEFEIYLKSCFKSVKIYYQSDIQASYIFSEKTMQNKLEKDVFDINKIVNYKKNESYFLIAVCSNVNDDENDIKENITLFNDKERKALLNEISIRNEIITNSEKLVVERDEYIKELEERLNG